MTERDAWLAAAVAVAAVVVVGTGAPGPRAVGLDALKLLAAFLAGIAVGAFLVAPTPRRGGFWLSSPWADSETWRQQP